MKRCLFLLLVVGALGCDSKRTSIPATEEKRPPAARDVPIIKPIRKEKAKTKVPAEPAAEAPYTFGDLITALQEDAKARESQGRLTGVDPRIFRPDSRHQRLRDILDKRYGQEITLASVLKLREELCKENELTSEEVNAITLSEVADAFEK